MVFLETAFIGQDRQGDGDVNAYIKRAEDTNDPVMKVNILLGAAELDSTQKVKLYGMVADIYEKLGDNAADTKSGINRYFGFSGSIGSFDAAEAYYNRALTYDNTKDRKTRIDNHLADLLEDAGDNYKNKGYMPNESHPFYYDAAMSYLEAGKHDPGRKEKMDKLAADAFENAGDKFLKYGDVEVGMNCYAKAVSLNPKAGNDIDKKIAEQYILLGQKGSVESRVENLSLALSFEPNNPRNNDIKMKIADICIQGSKDTSLAVKTRLAYLDVARAYDPMRTKEIENMIKNDKTFVETPIDKKSKAVLK